MGYFPVFTVGVPPVSPAGSYFRPKYVILRTPFSESNSRFVMSHDVFLTSIIVS